MHFVISPFSFVFSIVGPCIDAFAMDIVVKEFAYVN